LKHPFLKEKKTWLSSNLAEDQELCEGIWHNTRG